MLRFITALGQDPPTLTAEALGSPSFTNVFEFLSMEKQPVRVITWNCNKATASRATWDYFLDLKPDIALLQEVASIPESVRGAYKVVSQHAIRKNGSKQTFETAILTRLQIETAFSLASRLQWVQRELEWFSGNLLCCVLKLDASSRLRVVSVYSPAWPVAKSRLAGEDVAPMKLSLNEDVWVADLLWAALQEALPGREDPWIVGGDFNLSETFDEWRGGPRGNREYLDRMKDIGLRECLRQKHGKLVPTFLDTDKKTHIHQMDHLFVTSDLIPAMEACSVGDKDVVFNGRMSDHLPIIADFGRVELRR